MNQEPRSPALKTTSVAPFSRAAGFWTEAGQKLAQPLPAAVTCASRRVDWRSVTAFIAPFFLYLRTIAPTIYNLDSAELTTAAYTGGLMRATGYPLYLSIGYFWSRLPVGDVGFRMNLFSAFCGALTILLAERILRRLNVGGWAAFAALGLLATSVFFWGLSLVAEVYTLHTALMAGFVLALLRWSKRPEPGRAAWVGLIAGLGLAHHAAMVLLGPAAALFMVVSHPRKVFTPRAMLATLGGLTMGMSFFLYLSLRYLAEPAFNYAGTFDANLQFHPVDLTTPDGLWWLVSGKAFAGAMMAYSGSDLWHETQSFLAQLGRAFFAIGIGPGVLGVLVLLRRNWHQALLLGLMFVFNAGFYINYRVMDKETMFLPAYLIWALWVGIGSQAVLDWMRQNESEAKYRLPNHRLPNHRLPNHRLPNFRLGEMIVKGTLAGFVLLAVAWNWRIVDMSGDTSTRLRGEAILAQADAGGLVFGWWDTVPVVQYLQLVEGQRPDIQAVNRFLIRGSDLEYAIKKEVQNRPIYIDSLPKSLGVKLVARPIGPIYRVNLRADAQPVTIPSGRIPGLTGGRRP